MKIFQHLINNYSQINQHRLKQNKAKLNELWDTSLPFDKLISCARTIQEYATYGRRPIY